MIFLNFRNRPTVKTAPKFPSRRALAGLALVSVLSAVENQRLKKSKDQEVEIATEDMSGELQTIPARHGVATFVPRGRTIKVINTYGKQVVSMWAFGLGPPPEEDEDEEGETEAQEMDDEKMQQEAETLKKAIEEEQDEQTEESSSKGKEQAESSGMGKETQSTNKDDEQASEAADDPPEQAPDTPENGPAKQLPKRTWASYLPSLPYRGKGKANESQETNQEKEPTEEEKQALNEENTKKWSSYLPTGKGFSNYVPNVQLPDSKGVVSAFKSSHNRDPNKSYAEQLYDFSKTPVGAGTIAAATGSGYASSVYAAYNAYAQTHPSNSSQPPMEYLSLPHTRASTHKLAPEVDDELLTNLRNPIITLIEDTTPGAHDTLTAACDANLYTALGIEQPAEHGSCAENLVLALKELNENAGLKGAKAVGADISVNIAPTPLHLFMNAPLELPENASEENNAGAKGIKLSVEEPKGKKRSFVRFRAERDVVVVLSACPMDVGKQNGGRCMAANFMVEDVQEGEDLATSAASIGKKKPKKLNLNNKNTDFKSKDTKKESSPPKETAPAKKKAEPKKQETKKPEISRKPSAPRRDSATVAPKLAAKKPDTTDEANNKQDAQAEEPKAKKKPKKLQVRSNSNAPTPAKA